MIKRYVIMHETEGFIAAFYAERFELVPLQNRNSFTGNRSGNFFIGTEVVGCVDNPRCRVGVSAIADDSRRGENRGKCLTVEEIELIRMENLVLAAWAAC
jgi:hypothetical protein